MKRDKLTSAVWALLLSFALSCSAVMCVVTAFELKIDVSRLIAVCFGASAICSLCFFLPLSPVPLGIGAAFLGYLWRRGTLEAGIEAILNRLSRQYNNAYGWGIIRWGYRTADDMEPSILIPLCIVGALIALLAAWAVCRRKTVLPALLTAFLPLASCFVVTDTVPDSRWIYLLMLAFLVLLLTCGSRRQDEKQGNRLTLWLVPVTALSLMVLFAAIPQDTYSGQDNAKKLADKIFHADPVQLLMGHLDESGATGGESGSGSVDLRTVGYRVESDAQVLQVTAPFTGSLYLRGRSLDKYDGTSWSSWSGSEVDYTGLPWPEENLASVGEVTVTTRFAHRMLYLPYYTDTMQLLAVSGGMENDKKLTEYSFYCRRPEDPAYLTKLYPTTDSQAEAGQQALADAFMQTFPRKKSVTRWANSMAQKAIQGYTSPYHKAQAIASYVRNSASYDTQTPRMPLESKDFAKWFLEESDTGYCVHFATAATVLLQEAGIPARYVTGYLVPVQAGEQVVVRSDHAHAWAEYWLPGFGWTVLEATPADMRQDTQEMENTQAATQPTEDTLQETTAPSVETQKTPQKDKDTVLYAILGVAAVLVAAGLMQAQRALRLYLRRKKRRAAQPNARALLYWGDTVRYAKHLKRLPEGQLFEIAQLAKYSRHTVSEAQLQQFESAHAELVSQLKKKNILLQLYYRWLLALY